MAKPKSRGIGTGAAQVFDYSRIDNAMRDAMNIVSQKGARKAQREAEAAAEKEKALKKLRGELKYDTSKVKDVDREAIVAKGQAIETSMNGNWDKVYNGDPYWSNKYQVMVDDLNNAIADSADSKVQEMDLYKKALEPDSGFSPEKIAAMETAWTTPGYTPSRLREEGLFNRDQVVGDLFTKVDKSILDTGSALYKEVDTSYNSPTGWIKRKGREWLPDDEAKAKLLTTVQGSPEIMQDINIQYADTPEEERMDAFYEDYKGSRIDEQMATDTGKKDPTSSSTGSGSGVNISTFVNPNGVRGISLANIKKQMVPMTVTVPARGKQKEKTITIIPSEIYEKNGKWYLKGAGKTHAWEQLSESQKEKYGTEEDYNRTLATGETYNTEIYPSIASKLTASYGLDSDYSSYFKGNSNNNSVGELD